MTGVMLGKITLYYNNRTEIVIGIILLVVVVWVIKGMFDDKNN